MALELACEVGLDTGRDEHGPAVDGLFEAALNEAVGNGHLGDLALVQIRFKLAVRNLRDLRGCRKEILECHQNEESDDPVADIESGLLVHFHDRRSSLPMTRGGPGVPGPAWTLLSDHGQRTIVDEPDIAGGERR